MKGYHVKSNPEDSKIGRKRKGQITHSNPEDSHINGQHRPVYTTPPESKVL